MSQLALTMLGTTLAPEQGVSVSAVLEALASRLDDMLAEEIIQTARRVDADRRRRRPAGS